MINYESVQLDALCIHHVGNKVREEDLVIADQPIAINDDILYKHLLKYFFHNFKQPAFYHFNEDQDSVGPHPMMELIRNVFEVPSTIFDASIKIAEYLYDIQENGNIKSGDLMIAYFDNILVDDEMVNAIGIFKSENKDVFLKIKAQAKSFSMKYDEGMHIEKLDKGCLILNTEQEQGYKICLVDKQNEGSVANFWKNGFLRLKVRSDDYNFTSNFIQMTKSFVKDRLEPLYETDKLDEAGILNRSQKFFETNETFDQESYAEEIFKDEDVIQTFQEYKKDYEVENNLEIGDNFNVSIPAVKNKSKIFKSVLKLDKNFHIYIHGDRDKIERGQDEYGRKFYKIYYDKEE